MLVRSIRSSFSLSRFFCSLRLSENTRNAGNFNESLGAKLSRLRKPSEAPIVIAKWKEEGHVVSHDDIARTVRGLIDHKRHRQALMIYDSLVEQNIIELKPLDYANHMRLISNNRGLDFAEIYFEDIPEEMKCYITYSALLDIYVQSEETVKAESLMEKMAGGGFLTGAQPYIHMMSLYISIGKIDKAEEMIKVMRKHMKPNVRNYNIWLIACASKNNVEAAEMVFSKMKETKLKPDLQTLGTLAGLYIKNKMFEKAASGLKEMEELLSTGGRRAYCSLMHMHGNIGNRDEVLRIWEKMKLRFIKMNDYEYSLVVTTLLKSDSYEKAKEIYSEWATRFKKGRVPKIHGKDWEKMEKLLKNAKDGKNSPAVEEDEVQKLEENAMETGIEVKVEECNVEIQ